SEFDDDFLQQGLPSEEELEGALETGEGEWEEKKHKTLIGKVDSQLLSRIREYRENVHEMSEEKLSLLAGDENRDKLLMEAAQLAEEVDDASAGRDLNSVIAELDRKISVMI